jgi:hypothetical protein
MFSAFTDVYNDDCCLLFGSFYWGSNFRSVSGIWKNRRAEPGLLNFAGIVKENTASILKLTNGTEQQKSIKIGQIIRRIAKIDQSVLRIFCSLTCKHQTWNQFQILEKGTIMYSGILTIEGIKWESGDRKITKTSSIRACSLFFGK